MGEHGAALVCDDKRYGQVSRVGVRAQIAAVAHRCQTGLKQLNPLVVSGGEIVVYFVVGVDQLTGQRTVDTTAHAVYRVDVG